MLRTIRQELGRIGLPPLIFQNYNTFKIKESDANRSWFHPE